MPAVPPDASEYAAHAKVQHLMAAAHTFSQLARWAFYLVPLSLILYYVRAAARQTTSYEVAPVDATPEVDMEAEDDEEDNKEEDDEPMAADEEDGPRRGARHAKRGPRHDGRGARTEQHDRQSQPWRKRAHERHSTIESTRSSTHRPRGTRGSTYAVEERVAMLD